MPSKYRDRWIRDHAGPPSRQAGTRKVKRQGPVGPALLLGLALVLMLDTVDLPAQNLRLERHVMGALATGATSPSGLQLSATLGETATATLETGTVRHTQGFHQGGRCAWSGGIQASAPVLNCRDTLILLEDGYAVPGALRLWRDALGDSLGASAVLTVTSPGTYILEVSQDQCAASDTLVIGLDTDPPLLPALAADTLTCEDTLAALRILSLPGADDWLWRGPTGNAFTADTFTQVSISGWYTLWVTGPNGCIDTTGVAVDRSVEHPELSVTMEGKLDCVRDLVLLQAASNASEAEFLWSGPAGQILSDPGISVSAPGPWLVTVTDGANGCRTEMSVLVTLDTIPPQVSLLTDTLTCRDSVVWIFADVAGSGDFDFLWEDPDGGIYPGEMPEFPVDKGGRWEVLVTDRANGCRSEAWVEVVEFITTPQAEAGHAPLACLDETALLLGASADPTDELRWLDANRQLVGSGPQLPVAVGGTYTLQVVDAQGCTAEAQVTVGLSDFADLPSVFTPNDDGRNDRLDLHPCPGQGDHPPIALTVFNRWGAEVYRSDDYRHDWDGSHQGKLLPTGQYYYVVRFAQKEIKMPLTILY